MFTRNESEQEIVKNANALLAEQRSLILLERKLEATVSHNMLGLSSYN